MGALRSALTINKRPLVPRLVCVASSGLLLTLISSDILKVLFEGLGAFFSCLDLDLMVNGALEVELLFVTLLDDVTVQGEDNILRNF